MLRYILFRQVHTQWQVWATLQLQVFFILKLKSSAQGLKDISDKSFDRFLNISDKSSDRFLNISDILFDRFDLFILRY